MFKMLLMTIVILMMAGVNGGKLYLQVKHQQHFGIHELEEQEYIKLGPGSRLEQELNEYFEEHTAATTTVKTTTLQEDDYVDSEEDTTNTTTEDISLIESIIYANATEESPDEEAMLYTSKIKDLYDEESMLSANDTDDLYDQEITEQESTVGRNGEKSWYAPFTERATRIKQYLSKKFRSLGHLKKKKVDIDDKESNFKKENKTGIEKKSEMELETLRKWNDVYSRGKRSKKSVDANLKLKTSKNDLKLKLKVKDTKDKLKKTITWVSVIIVVVLVLFLITYCCVKMGCPCCYLCCPCLVMAMSFKSSMDPSELKKEKMKTVVPGVITHKDGTIEHYKPSQEEMECLLEIMGK